MFPLEKVMVEIKFQMPESLIPVKIIYDDSKSSAMNVELINNSFPPKSEIFEQKNLITDAKLGDFANADGYRAYAISIEPCSECYAIEGYEALKVDIDFKNSYSDRPLEIYKSLPGIRWETPEIYLVDTDGYIYLVDSSTLLVDNGLKEIMLNKGEEVQGYLIFNIQESATPAYIRFGNLVIGLIIE